MAEAIKSAPKFAGLTYCVIMIAIIFAQLLPLQTIPRTWPYPDFLILVTLVYAARRPALLPAGAVIFCFLLADFLLQRPPGLWAFIMLMSAEIARRSAEHLRSSRFSAEWLTVSGIIGGAYVLAHIIQAILMAPRPPLSSYAFQCFSTMAIYPAVVFVAAVTLNLRKRAPGELDHRGRKI